jgi:hypothetical protein
MSEALAGDDTGSWFPVRMAMATNMLPNSEYSGQARPR